jgi:hypothetical protein
MRLIEIDSGDAGARAGEGARDLTANASGRAGQQNRLAFQTSAEIERHGLSLR